MFSSFSNAEVLGFLAVAIGLFGYVFYIRGIIKGEVKPHAFTWFVWGLLTAIGFIAQIVGGGGPGAWVTGMTAAMSFIFAAIGLGASSRIYIAKSDWIFFLSALIAIPIWYFTGSPLWAVVIITVIDAVAFAPTFRKAYFHPQTENMWTYLFSGIKFVFGIAALQTISITTVLYPLSLVFANGAFVAMSLWRRRVLVRTQGSTEDARG
jgi:hypothetical protein